MRWKLIRRRLSLTSPRMAVRTSLPWPLRWAAAALMLGFSMALALWAFELGKNLAGLEPSARVELAKLRDEVSVLKVERDKAQAIGNTASSLLKAEHAAQEQLASQLRQAESEKLSLQADLAFFERLLPVENGSDSVLIRGLQVEPEGAGLWRYQVLVVQRARRASEFNGRFELLLQGTAGARTWQQAFHGVIDLKQYIRLEGRVQTPANAVVKTVQLRILDAHGSVKVTHQSTL